MKVWILSSVLRYWGPDKHTKQFSLQMRNLKLFITAVCVVSLTKLPWPKSKSLYAEQLQKNYLYLGGKPELDSKYLTIVPQWAAAKTKKKKYVNLIPLSTNFETFVRTHEMKERRVIQFGVKVENAIIWVMFLSVVKARLMLNPISAEKILR